MNKSPSVNWYVETITRIGEAIGGTFNCVGIQCIVTLLHNFDSFVCALIKCESNQWDTANWWCCLHNSHTVLAAISCFTIDKFVCRANSAFSKANGNDWIFFGTTAGYSDESHTIVMDSNDHPNCEFSIEMWSLRFFLFSKDKQEIATCITVLLLVSFSCLAEQEYPIWNVKLAVWACFFSVHTTIRLHHTSGCFTCIHTPHHTHSLSLEIEISTNKTSIWGHFSFHPWSLRIHKWYYISVSFFIWNRISA